MSELPDQPVPADVDGRCPNCDSRVSPGDARCLMCGAELPARHRPPEETAAEAPARAVTAVAPAEPTPEVVTSVMRERQSTAVFWMTAVAFLITAFIGALIVQHSGPVTVALFPTLTPLPPTSSYTPTITPPATDTPPPSETPTITPPPLPTDTPRPPRFATIAAGETLFGWSLRYDVSVESIIALNGLGESGIVQAGQALQVPWPTATPPLMPVEVAINGQPAIADPRGCEWYEIQEGDALFAVAANYDVPLDALLAANRRTGQDVVNPGDRICIPAIIYDGVLPPTPGPSPTPSQTPLPGGPALLYPVQDAVVDSLEKPVVLQWAAVKDLAEDEWYMVEVTDLSDVEGRPHRAFTRQTSLRLPTAWRPWEPEIHRFRWRVSIVQVTGRRNDGQFIYTYGGGTSQDAHFGWLGAVPTTTPTFTPSPTPENGS